MIRIVQVRRDIHVHRISLLHCRPYYCEVARPTVAFPREIDEVVDDGSVEDHAEGLFGAFAGVVEDDRAERRGEEGEGARVLG